MIYFVSGQPHSIFENETYRRMNVNDAIKEIESWTRVQFDIETNGLDPHIAKMTCMQFGNKSKDIQIVVDTSTTSVISFKRILETKFIIGHNLKFDFQFLYNYKIVPTRVYDTMIVEQLRYLGYGHLIRYGLSEVLYRNMNTQMDKRIREEIHWRGLDDAVIQYAANDVVYLEDLMEIQLNWCHQNTCLPAAKLECDFVPVIAYLEWCGIKLDINRWSAKMAKDKSIMDLAKIELDAVLIKRAFDGNHKHRNLKSFTKVNRQGDLFTGFDTEPKCTVNWKSSPQTIKVFTSLGFNCKTVNKQTSEETESVLATVLKKQKGIDDEFLNIYFTYIEAAKIVSTYGQSYLNAINPKTGRIHTVFRQLGADTGRMSCGSGTSNSDLAKLKDLPLKLVSYPQLQNLPSDTETRACFVSEPNNYMVACDYSALESRLGADIYADQAMIDEFLYGSGDIHSLVAKFSFEEIAHLDVKTIKKDYPNLRQRAKGVGFSQQFENINIFIPCIAC